MDRQKETRNTRQRDLILQCLKDNSDRHLNAEEIYALLKRDDARLGIATVYRNLKHLEEQGVVEKLCMNNEATCYKILNDASCEHSHHHLKCQECGSVIDFEHDLLEAIEKIIEVTKGFRITDHRVVFYGVCRECAARQETRK